MICPRCAHEKSMVLSTDKSTVVERYRKCLGCGYVWATVELPKADIELRRYAKDLFGDKSIQRRLKDD